jgi:hypothetical protein
MSEKRWFIGKYKVEVIEKKENTWRVRALERIPLPLADGLGNPISIGGLIGVPLAITPMDEFESAPENFWEEEEEDRCCICGKPATISSEGSSYCYRCAMLHAK